MINCLAPQGFDSWSSYCQFAVAREFYQRDTNQPFVYSKTFLEKMGGVLSNPLTGIADKGLRNIKNPLMILTLTGVSVIAVTILFYPNQFIRQIGLIAPIALNIKPWMLKGALFATIQTTILGLGLRTLGRLNPNGPLWQAWTNRQIFPILIGTEVIVRGHP